MLKDDLTIPQQQEILKTLFGITLVNTNDDHWVPYDAEGDEFYAANENVKYELSTLGGIFAYAMDISEKRGYRNCQLDMQKVLGVIK